MKRNLAAAIVILLAVGCATSGAAPSGSAENPASISWKAVRREKDSTSIKGSLRAPFGLFTLTWRIGADGAAVLADEEPSGTGEMPIYDKTLLYPWLSGDGTAHIFRVRTPVIGSNNPLSLHLVAVVKRTELLSGLAEAASKGSTQISPAGLQPPESRAPAELSDWDSSGLVWRLTEKGLQRLYLKKGFETEILVLPWTPPSTQGIPSTSLVFEIASHKVDGISFEYLICHAKVDAARMLPSR